MTDMNHPRTDLLPGDTDIRLWAAREIDRLQAENERLRKCLEDCADGLACQIEHHYLDTLDYPSQKRKYDLDMAPVNEARAILAAPPHDRRMRIKTCTAMLIAGAQAELTLTQDIHEAVKRTLQEEMDRLRSELAATKKFMDKDAEDYEKLRAENERLRAACKVAASQLRDPGRNSGWWHTHIAQILEEASRPMTGG